MIEKIYQCLIITLVLVVVLETNLFLLFLAISIMENIFVDYSLRPTFGELTCLGFQKYPLLQ